MMVTAVDTALLGGTVRMPDMSIAGKTGTAQIPSPRGGYEPDKTLHAFVGYFPAYDPQFLIFLYTIEPKGVQFASDTLARPFMDLVTFLRNYYDVEPDRTYESIL